jgi:hypothetical protein
MFRRKQNIACYLLYDGFSFDLLFILKMEATFIRNVTELYNRRYNPSYFTSLSFLFPSLSFSYFRPALIFFFCFHFLYLSVLAGKCSLWFLLAHWLVFVRVSKSSYSPYHSVIDKCRLHLKIFLQQTLRQNITTNISLLIDIFLLYLLTMFPCILCSVTSLKQSERCLSYVYFRTNVAIKGNLCHASSRLILNDLIGVQNNF